MKAWDIKAGKIQLKAYSKSLFDNYWELKNLEPDSLDPEISFEIIPEPYFLTSDQFSFAFLTQSPEYTPSSADGLIPLIMDYVDT